MDPQASRPLPALPDDPLVAELADEMARRWEQGDCVPAEEYLQRYPELRQTAPRALGLIYEEICLRQEHSLPIGAEELFRRFPQWRPQLELMLECHELLAPEAAPHFPGAGDTVAGYQLLSPLGTGAAGHVYLARQPALADRPVVVKLTSLQGQEHLRLARLQHTHIVPLYAAHDEPARNLRLLCMPYFGGAALDQVLQALAGRPLRERSGASLLEFAQDGSVQAAGPAEPVLRRLSYVEALCWIGTCLAEALHYAHQGGLLHLDLKPSNVLIAADGQPMLLDFHLARAPLPAGVVVPEGIGGTHGYMPPEQEQALTAVAQARPIPRAIDHRADIFALSAVLYEALGGKLPYLPGQSPPLHRQNSQVSIGLSDILEKCLAPDASDRYANAADLASDLRLHLADHPLQGVRNRSWLERLHKWRRRRPAAFRTYLLLAVLLGALGALTAGALAHWAHVVEDIERSLLEGHKDWQEHGQYAEAVARLRGGLEIAQQLPLQEARLAALEEEIRQAEQAWDADKRRSLVRELHALAEQVRVLYGVDGVPAARLQPLRASGQALWAKRQQIRTLLDQANDQGATEDLIDLVLFAAEQDRAGRAYLAAVDEAEALFGPSAVLAAQRQRLRRALGLPPDARPPVPPRTEWEHFTLGRLCLQAGELAQATEHLQTAVARMPYGFWPNYYYGLCCYRTGRPLEAVSSFSVCIGAAPRVAAVYYNRALAFTAMQKPELALGDYDHALTLEPTLAGAALNRGMLHYEAGRYSQAETDLRHALQTGAEPVAVHFNLALLYHAWAKNDLAREQLALVLAADPQHAGARQLQARLGAR